MAPGPLFPSVLMVNSCAALMVSQSGPCMDGAPFPTIIPTVAIAAFTHSVQTCSNAVKFAHQLLGSPKISSLLKATQKGFLNGCSNITVNLITKYLNPSPGTAKGHMKRPQHGIKSTRLKQSSPAMPIAATNLPPMPQSYTSVPSVPALPQEPQAYLGHPGGNTAGPNLNGDEEDDESIANMFCFGTFTDRNRNILYHNLTGSFTFMSYDGSVCFFILYHYESNSILATPIAGLSNVSIIQAYKQQFKMLKVNSFKPKLNIMDNQATKHIKTYCTKNKCKLQLVEPHNHCVNAAIQTLKDTFVSALAMTDSNFPLQLWDKLTPLVQDTLNLLRTSRIDPSKSAYEILNGLYNWDRYPLAPLGCKAVVDEEGNTHGLWALQGVDTWYLGLSKDHYNVICTTS